MYRPGSFIAYFAAALLAVAAPLATGQDMGATGQGMVARQLTPSNLATLPPGGLDAIGGSGDWLLGNGTLCAVVSAPEHQAYLSLYGGTLVDLWHCDRANDQWVTLHEQRNLAKDGISRPVAVSASTTAQAAEVVVRSEDDGITTLARYRLGRERPTELRVRYELTREAPGDALHMLGMIMLHPRAAMVPYTLNLQRPAYATGAHQPYIDTRYFTEVLAAVAPASARVLAGVPGIEPAISYGLRITDARLRDTDGAERAVQQFFIGSETFTNFGLFSEPFLLPASETPGALNFLRGQFMDIAVGETLLVDLAITVGDRPDVASVTDQWYRGPRVSGRVDAGPAGITVFDASTDVDANANAHANGSVLTFVRSAPDGSFSFRLPQGVTHYRLEVATPWSTRRHTFASTVRDTGTLATGAYTVVHIPDIGPASLVFRGEGGTPDPVLFDTLTGASLGGERLYTARESNRLNLAGVPGDVRSLRLAPGRYRVIASRGIEYDLGRALLEAVAGESVVLDIAPPARAIATPGLVAADLHLHSGASLDSNITPRQRVTDFVAQGGEILVATEHNITVDLAPLVAAMGLADAVTALGGVEITGMARSPAAPYTIGHANVFPVPARPAEFRGGTLPFENKRLGRVIGDYRAAHPQAVFQLNHPRTDAYDSDLSFFNHLSLGEPFDSSLPLSATPNDSLLQPIGGSDYRDIDFDAMEIFNGESLDDYRMIREDWFALLRQGYFKIGTANSDSHLSAQLVAMPRTYLRLDEDKPLDAAAVSAALRSGDVHGTSGPVLAVTLGGLLPGQTFAGAHATLRVTAEAAPWVGVDELRVYLDGKPVHTGAIAAGQTVELPMEFKADGFVVVEVSGPVTDDYADVAPGFEPLAFSNPIFIDHDSNGYHRE